MKEDNKGFFSQRTFDIFFSGVFVFIMAMLLKEKLETPENYLENVKKSEVIAGEELAPPLKEVFESNSISEGRMSRGSSSLRYGITFENSNGITDDNISKIKADGWIQYKKDYQEKGSYFFCKDKYGLEATEGERYISTIIEYSKSSPCWEFKETLKDDFYQLVE